MDDGVGPAEIWSDSGFGSGYAIGGRLILTAAHVVCPDGRPSEGIRIRCGGRPPADGEVVWHQPEDGLDVAIVRVTDDSWEPIHDRPPWGELVTGRPRQRFHATGYPDVQASDRRRDTEQASGRINPGTTARAGRLALSVDDPPSGVSASRSPWQGMSGAGVVCDGLLTGVVVQDPYGYDSRRLVAVPVSAFARDPGLVEIAGAVPLHPVELQPIAAVAPRAGSPATLLRADVAVTPFRPRPELDDLLGWCRAEPVWAARQIVGPGGQGKTRLARELALTVGRAGWTSVVIAETATELAVLAEVTRPILVIVDYAETRVAQVAEVARHLGKVAGKVRLLLLSRSAGWPAEAVSVSAHLDFLRTLETVELGPLEASPGGRVAAWHDVLHAMTAALPALDGYAGVPWPEVAARLPEPSLTSNRYQTILAVQIEALAALLRAGLPADRADPGSAADLLLAHEVRYWRKANVSPDLAVTRRLVFLASFWGAADAAEAHAVLRATRDFRNATDDAVRAADARLSALYHEKGRHWSRLQPDLLAEHLIATVLSGAEGPGLLATTRAASPAQITNALTLLAQAAAHHDVAAPVLGVLRADPDRAGAAALEVATRVGRVAPLLDGVHRLVAEVDPATLATFRSRLPERSAALADIAILILQRTLKEYDYASNVARIRAGQTTRERMREAWFGDTTHLTHLRGMAEIMEGLSRRLIAAGRRPEAADWAAKALMIRQKFLNENDDDTLVKGMNLYAKSGSGEKALNAAQAVVANRRLQVQTDPAAQPALIDALVTYSTHLAENGKRPEAVAVAYDAWQQAYKLDGDASTPLLARAVTNLAVISEPPYVGVAMLDAVRVAAQMGVDAYVRLYEQDRDSYQRDCALALVVRARVGHEMGEDVLEMAESAVRVLVSEGMSGPDPAAFRAGATFLIAAGGRRAVTSAEELVTICELGMQEDPVTYRPLLSDALTGLAAQSTGAAVTTALERAVETWRHTGDDSAAGPGLAAALERLALHARAAGDVQRASAAAAECLAVRRRLVADQPSLFTEADLQQTRDRLGLQA